MSNVLSFRTLRADEIDCRISTVKSNGLSLLLYKDARCDMNILDETVGAFGWKREHSRDNANCTVSIYDSENEQWVPKEDTGTESYTEKEKGLASDSFKRACFNWGIGRELYTAPFIWITSGNCEINDSGRKDGHGRSIFTCYDKFYVSDIDYDENRCINRLQIKHSKTDKVVFELGKLEQQEPDPEPPKDVTVTDLMINHLRMLFEEHEIDEEKVCACYSAATINDLKVSQYKGIVNHVDEFKKKCGV